MNKMDRIRERGYTGEIWEQWK